MEALLVVDIDGSDGWLENVGLLTPERKRVSTVIRATLRQWRREKKLIIFIVLVPTAQKRMAQLEYCENPNPEAGEKHCIVCDLEYYHLAPFLGHRHGESYEPAFIKIHNDACTNAEFVAFLKSKGVTDTTLVGCLTFDCLHATAKGIAKNGMNVTLLERGAYRPFANDEAKQRWIAEVQKENPAVRVEIR